MLEAYDKHFLDSSVMRPMLLGSGAYKQYFKNYFGEDRLYISNYVQMEFVRSFIVPLLNFYFVLDLPSVKSISDGLTVWSNRFRTSELKAVIQVVSEIFQLYLLDFADPGDKEKALRAFGRIIRRYFFKIRRKFNNIGDRGSNCARAKIALKQKQGVNDREIFDSFLDSFLNLAKCKSSCTIEHFFCKRYKSEVQRFVAHASTVKNRQHKENIGFIAISDKLCQILEKNIAPSCQLCKVLGDAVITLETPKNMRLEHTDYSFDHLCSVSNKPHYRHPSEISVVKNQS